jgi:hypothetical protein
MPRGLRIGHPTYRLTSDQGAYTLTGQNAALTFGGGSADGSWASRSVASGVCMACGFDTPDEVDDYLHPTAYAQYASHMEDDPIVDTYMRIWIPSFLGDTTAEWRRFMDDSWTDTSGGFGSDPWYVSTLYRMGTGRNATTGGDGYKLTNFAGINDSNVGNEIVFNNTFGTDILGAYRNNGGAGAQNFNNSDSDYLQLGLDRGSGDPEDRYCLDTGLGVPSAGCWFIPENKWFEIYMEAHIVYYGSTGGDPSGNSLKIYVLEEGWSQRLKVWDVSGFRIGSDATLAPNGPLKVWHLGYDTDRISGPNNTWMDYARTMCSRSPIAAPQELIDADPTDPAWMSAQSDKRWTSNAASATLEDAGAGAALTTGYSGGTVDQKTKRFIIGPGHGHGDGVQNYLFAYDLSEDTIAAEMILASNTGGASQTDADFSTNGSGAFPNGQMRGTHSYQDTVYGGGKLIMPKLGSVSGSEGNWTTAIWTSDNATGSWTARGKGFTSPASGNNWRGGSSIWDPKTHRAWSVATGANTGTGFYSYDPTANDIDGYNFTFLNGPGYSWSVCLPDRRLWVAGFDDQGLMYLDLDDPGAGWIDADLDDNGLDCLPEVNMGNQQGAVYDYISSGIFLWWKTFGTSMVKIDVPDDPTDTWSASTFTANSGGATPTTGNSQGTYGRFNIIQNSYSGHRYLVLVNKVDEPLFIYRIPLAGM